MNTIVPYLIAAAVLMPLLALMVSLYLWVHRHRQPDVACLKILYGLLWFLFCVLLAGLVALVALVALIGFGGSGITSATSILLPVCSLIMAAGSIAFQIRQCNRRLRQK